MKNKKYISGTYSYLTDIGKVRLSNEDRVGVFVNAQGNVLMVVCDGMGGERKGEYASSLTLSIFKEAFEHKSRFFTFLDTYRFLRRTAALANKKILQKASSNANYSGMGTTLTAVLIVNNYYYVLHIGDSRAYTFRNRQLNRVTEDQTLVNHLMKTGKITVEQMKTHPQRHILMNSLGSNPILSFDLMRRPYMEETILVCSDGLYNNLSEKDIHGVLRNTDTSEQKVNQLIRLANSNGGSDNIAVALWEASK